MSPAHINSPNFKVKKKLFPDTLLYTACCQRTVVTVRTLIALGVFQGVGLPGAVIPRGDVAVPVLVNVFRYTLVRAAPYAKLGPAHKRHGFM